MMASNTIQADKQTVTFQVNNESYTVIVYPMKRLLDVLREDVQLTGTKEGCGEGECGACTVIMNGLPTLSCMTAVCQAQNATIRTIEGVGSVYQLHPIQEAFNEEGGAQCGICTPGMIMSAIHYMEHPDSAQNLREALAGNQCRCTGYVRIFSSVEKAFEKAGKNYPDQGDDQ
jgi:carbon-monoxide dehydrogenase small subunit